MGLETSAGRVLARVGGETMKRWKVKFLCTGLLDRRQYETVEVSADSEHAACCIGLYVVGGLYPGFKQYDLLECVDENDPRFSGNGSLAA